MIMDPVAQLTAVHEAIVGRPPDPAFADRAREILSANGNSEWVPQYLLDAFQHLATGELVPPTDVPADLHGLAYYLGQLAPLFPGAEIRDEDGNHIELFVPRLARSIVVDHERWSVVPAKPAEPQRPTGLRSLGTFTPSDDQIRAWARDPDLLFAFQDEDDAIGNDVHIPLLVELAADPATVKRDKILRVLDGTTTYGLRRAGGLARIERVLAELAKHDRMPDELRAWAADKQRLRDFLTATGPISRDAARAIAPLLLIGSPHEEPALGDWLHFTAPDEHAYIHPPTGAVAFDPSQLPASPGPARIAS